MNDSKRYGYPLQGRGMTGGADSITEEVILSVASQTGTDSMELPPLIEAINPDVLELLFDRDTTDGIRRSDRTLIFTYAGCTVHIESGNNITITEHEQSAGRPSQWS